MAYFTVMDPVTGGNHTPTLGVVTTMPMPETPGETFDEFRERLLIRWVREQHNQNWCGTFDNIMVAQMGYTATEIHAAQAKLHYHHSADIEVSSPTEIKDTPRTGISATTKKYIKDYFGITDAKAAETTLELVREPEPDPADMSELDKHKRQVMNAVLGNTRISATTQSQLLTELGYTAAQIRDGRTSNRWIYKLSIAWHCAAKINYPTDLAASIKDRVLGYNPGLFVTDCKIHAATEISFK